MAENKQTVSQLKIIYDGDCPFCRRYTDYLTLKQSIEHVELIDARQDVALVKELLDHGCNLDEGMVVIADDVYYAGSDAVMILSHLSDKSSFRSKIYYFFFHKQKIAAFFYPFLRFIRNTVIKLLGKKPLND